MRPRPFGSVRCADVDVRERVSFDTKPPMRCSRPVSCTCWSRTSRPGRSRCSATSWITRALRSGRRDPGGGAYLLDMRSYAPERTRLSKYSPWRRAQALLRTAARAPVRCSEPYLGTLLDSFQADGCHSHRNQCRYQITQLTRLGHRRPAGSLSTFLTTFVLLCDHCPTRALKRRATAEDGKRPRQIQSMLNAFRRIAWDC